MEPGGGSDLGYVSDFGNDHDHHGHGDHGHGDHGHGDHGDHFGGDGGDHGDHGEHGSDGQSGQNSLKGLIARLLGLDRDAGSLAGGGDSSSDHGHGHDAGQTPSQSAMYANALAGISLSEAFKGIRVTPNFLYLCLFAGFFGWLFVVYWIRHNEPMANQVLGGETGRAHTSYDDRILLNSVKQAMPFRTSAKSGEIYTPNAPKLPQSQPTQQQLLSTAAAQPQEMSKASSQFASQFIGQQLKQAAGTSNALSLGQALAPGGFGAQTQSMLSPIAPMSGMAPQTQPFMPGTAQAGHRLASYAQPASTQRHHGFAQAAPQAYGGRAYNGAVSPYGGQVGAPLMSPAYAAMPSAPAPLMEAPHGLTGVPQQFGTARHLVVPVAQGESLRLKTVINH
ncbi:MAG: hypothetical protein IAF58_14575 [Leptolyngbya sp.]|nr:hypothetical protein [Candidatus Melainabacteria bacterium]